MKQQEKMKLKLKIINDRFSLVYESNDKIKTLLSWATKKDFITFLNELQELGNKFINPETPVVLTKEKEKNEV